MKGLEASSGLYYANINCFNDMCVLYYQIRLLPLWMTLVSAASAATADAAVAP